MSQGGMVESLGHQRESATLAGGCFWCLEAIFGRLRGVMRVTPGYTGGHLANPTYRQVCAGSTGHAEAVQIVYDPKVISFQTLLDVFFSIHDPTSLNRQGDDVGEQYRSAIFYRSDSQRRLAETMISDREERRCFDRPIVTELTPLGEFYPAEPFHHNYYNVNSNQPYCQVVIAPKLAQFSRDFEERLR